MNYYQGVALNISALPEDIPFPRKAERRHLENVEGYIFSVIIAVDKNDEYFQYRPHWHCSAAIMVNDQPMPISIWKEEHFSLAVDVVTKNLNGVGDLTTPDNLMAVQNEGIALHCRRLLTIEEAAEFESQKQRYALIASNALKNNQLKPAKKPWWKWK